MQGDAGTQASGVASIEKEPSESPSRNAECRISVVIPVRAATSQFERCLDALHRTDPSPVEVIIVADGPDSEIARIAAASNHRFHALDRNAGPAAARNAGAGLAEGDVVMFVDSDVELRADAVGTVAGVFCSDRTVTAVFGSYDSEPAETNLLSQYKNLMHHYTHQAGREEAFTFWAGCGAIRKDAFARIGGFSEKYRRPAIEDIELGYRLAKAGDRVRLVKELQCKHLKRWTVRSLFRSDFFDRAIPWTRLILETGSSRNDLNLHWSRRLCVVLAWVLTGSAVLVLAAPAAALWTALAAATGLLLLDHDIWRFFLRHRGAAFCVRILPWHWFQYFYSGIAAVIGALSGSGDRHGPPSRVVPGQAGS